VTWQYIKQFAKIKPVWTEERIEKVQNENTHSAATPHRNYRGNKGNITFQMLPYKRAKFIYQL
jgi:hypothetical protein